MGERKRAIRFAYGGKIFPIRNNQNAQALIEFVLILPILLVLVVGAIELGRLWSTKIILTNAAREGAYYLTTHVDDYKDCGTICFSGTKAAAQAEANSSGLTLAVTDIVVTTPCCTVGTAAKVTTNTQVKDLLLLGVLANFTVEKTHSGNFPLSSTVEMMVQ